MGKIYKYERPAAELEIMPAQARPSEAQLRYLRLGLNQPGGKLPLFDPEGQEIPVRTIRSCIDKGWCEPWFRNPIKPDWLVCRLTDLGREVLRKLNYQG